MQVELAHKSTKYVLTMVAEGVWVFDHLAVTSVDHATSVEANEAAKTYIDRQLSGEWRNGLRVSHTHSTAA